MDYEPSSQLGPRFARARGNSHGYALQCTPPHAAHPFTNHRMQNGRYGGAYYPPQTNKQTLNFLRGTYWNFERLNQGGESNDVWGSQEPGKWSSEISLMQAKSPRVVGIPLQYLGTEGLQIPCYKTPSERCEPSPASARTLPRVLQPPAEAWTSNVCHLRWWAPQSHRVSRISLCNITLSRCVWGL